MEKSYVSLEQKMCIVTGVPYDTNSLLLDKRLKSSMEKHTVTGWGISPEIQEKIDAGFVALVGIDTEKSKITDDKILPEDAYRTGAIAYIRREVLLGILMDNSMVGENPFIFVDDEFIDKLRLMNNQANENTDDTINN